jgi:Secretion system C-terminal sorting domain
MKELQLWLVSVFLCCALMGQSPGDHSNMAVSTDAGLLFSFFTVTPQNGHAILRWAFPPVKSEDFFIVERSSDALHFEMLSAMDASVGTDSVYSLVDNSVGPGTISYRIRIIGKDGKEQYSKTVNMNTLVDADIRFYPNPVDKLLIIRSSHALSIQVQDSYGIVWFTQEVGAGMQIVNVSALQKGTYILKATDKSTNTVFSEQLVKNN